MFTGIIESTGSIQQIEHQEGFAQLTVQCPVVTGSAHGASIAVHGVCLTITDPAGCQSGEFTVDVMGETLQRTGFGDLAVGDQVNIERAMPASGRLDGHVVQGHVDGVGTLAAVTDHGNWTTLRVQLPADFAEYIVEKGSITLNGVSLTITAVSPAAADHTWLEVGLIPETLALTAFGNAQVGDVINVEVDVLAKYVARLIAVREARKS